MSRIVAIQMDPIESIDIKGDSTFVMGLEAQSRGYDLLHYHPDDMFYDRGRVLAEVRPMTLRYEAGNHYELGDARIINLARETDVILMRQDPPFDMNYITATHLLESGISAKNTRTSSSSRCSAMAARVCSTLNPVMKT